MATKRTNTKSPAAAKAAKKKAAAPKAAAKKPKAPKAEAKDVGPRHPHARVAKAHGNKADLAKSLAPALVAGDEDAGALTERLSKASNTQLLRLQHVVETVKTKFGSREKLIEAIGNAQQKSKDKDYLAKLATLPLPRLLDLAQSATRSARA
jgi:hypothetical protein